MIIAGLGRLTSLCLRNECTVLTETRLQALERPGNSGCVVAHVFCGFGAKRRLAYFLPDDGLIEAMPTFRIVGRFGNRSFGRMDVSKGGSLCPAGTCGPGH